MKGPQQATGSEVFGKAASFSQGSSSSEDKNERSSIFSPARPKTMKRICNSNKIIEVSDSDEEEREAKDFVKKNKK